MNYLAPEGDYSAGRPRLLHKREIQKHSGTNEDREQECLIREGLNVSLKGGVILNQGVPPGNFRLRMYIVAMQNALCYPLRSQHPS